MRTALYVAAYVVTLAAVTLSLLFALEALAQERPPDVLLKRNIRATETHQVLLEDGGCTFFALGTATWDSGLQLVTQSESFPFNGARCATIRTAGNAAMLKTFLPDAGAP